MKRQPTFLLSWTLVCVSVLGAVSLAACSVFDSPERTVSGFMDAVNEGKSSQILNYVCGDIVVPPLPTKLISNVSYQTLDNNGVLAHVRVRGEVRVSIGVEVKKEFDYTAVVSKDRDRWCIQKESVANFLTSLTQFK